MEEAGAGAEEEKAAEEPSSSKAVENPTAAEADGAGEGVSAGKPPTPEKETSDTFSDESTLLEQVNYYTAERSQLRDLALKWADKCRRAGALFEEKCAQLNERDLELGGCRLKLEAIREEARARELAWQEKTDGLQAMLLQAEESAELARSRGKQIAGQEGADELQVKLLQTEEALEVAQGRAERILRDHERIVEEHAEYEELIQRKGGSTISEVETQTTDLLEQYLELKEVCGSDAPELREALKVLEERATMYKTVLARRPELRELLSQSAGEAGSSSSQVAPRRRQPQVGPSRGGRAIGRSSGGTRGR